MWNKVVWILSHGHSKTTIPPLPGLYHRYTVYRLASRLTAGNWDSLSLTAALACPLESWDWRYTLLMVEMLWSCLVGSLPVVLFVYLCVDVRQLLAVDVVLTCVVVIFSFLSFFLLLAISLQHTLETALLSASQEIEQSSDNPAAVQSLIQQRDVLQNGLLSTCRELARVNTVSSYCSGIY